MAAIAVEFREGSEELCNISGSPFTLQQLLHAQGLSTWFGLPDHRKRLAPAEEGSAKRDRVKRRKGTFGASKGCDTQSSVLRGMSNALHNL